MKCPICIIKTTKMEEQIMETIIEIDKKYHEKMPLEKKTEFLFEYKSKLYDNTLDDNYHTLKRNIGFAWFDRMLRDCQKGNCPRYFSNDIFYALTDISLFITERLKNTNGKKFVFFDSITTMLIHNEPYVFARFIHSILTRMRLSGAGGLLISLAEKTNREVRAEIAQLCDKVIKID